MIYLLSVTFCAITGPGKAVCDEAIAHLGPDHLQCLELRAPMLKFLDAEATAAGVRLIYIAATCKGGAGA